jgi:hypothetical protein
MICRVIVAIRQHQGRDARATLAGNKCQSQTTSALTQTVDSRAARVCDCASMAQNLCVIVSAEDRMRLGSIIEDRNRPLKHIQRAQIVLFSADRLPVLQVARRAIHHLK